VATASDNTKTPHASAGIAIRDLLQAVYPDHDTDALVEAVVDAFWPEGTHCRAQPRQPDNSLWSETDALVITYGNTLEDGKHKPLDLLNDFMHRYLKRGISGVHVLPFFPFSSDDGFAVIDFEVVDPRLGEWVDIQRISADFSLMSDLVLNHVSSQSRWFNEYLQRNEPYDRYFLEADPAENLNEVVRPRTSPLLREVDTSDGKRHVWCTFSHDQVDVDFRNPEVLLAFLRIIRLHIDNGVRIVRLDAVAFLWKELGTQCIHLRQTHEIVKLIRVLCNFAEEPVVLLTETNVPKAENLSYFGNRDEAHAIYNFPLPPLILHAMLSGTARHLLTWQKASPPAPLGCAYLNFTASHDGIGMRPAEGLLSPDEQAEVFATIEKTGGRVSWRSLPDGGKAPYELNTTFFDALTETFNGPDDLHVERFVCSQTIPMSLEGIPAFYIHALLATANDHDAAEKREMNRAINRHHWHYPELRGLLDDPNTVNARVLKALLDRLDLRSKQAAFHPNATQYTVPVADERVFALWRQSLDRSQSLFALHNVSADTVSVPVVTINLIDDRSWVDLLSSEPVEANDITLSPYQCRWISNLNATDHVGMKGVSCGLSRNA